MREAALALALVAAGAFPHRVRAVPPPCSEEELLETSDFAIEGYVTRVTCGEPYDSGECGPAQPDDPAYRPELVSDCRATVRVTAGLKGPHAIGDLVTIAFTKLARPCEGGVPIIPGSPKKDIRPRAKIRYYDSAACAYWNLEEIEAPFVRGDANDDGRVDIGDAIAILNALFAGGATPAQPEALDVNGDGSRDIGDPIYLLNFLFADGPPPPDPSPRPGSEVRLVLLYDNDPFDPVLQEDWGFSCLVEAQTESVLFDVGGGGSMLLGHMARLGVDPLQIDAVALSHIHDDHVGGLSAFLDRRADLPVYIPASFPGEIREEILSHGAQPVEIRGPVGIGDGVFSTGEREGSPNEQGLIVETEEGLVVIVACAHPGIVQMVREAKEQRGRDVFLVLGGFHLFRSRDGEVRDVIDAFRALGVERVAPCHCTGERACALFREAYGDAFIEVGVGAVISVQAP